MYNLRLATLTGITNMEARAPDHTAVAVVNGHLNDIRGVIFLEFDFHVVRRKNFVFEAANNQ
jgi:hypothetical protein